MIRAHPLLGLVAWLCLTVTWFLDARASGGLVQPATGTTEQLRFARQLSGAFQSAAEKIAPSVVHITQLNRVLVRRSWFDEGEARIQPTGLGSGVIVRSDGYILTNYHVIADADQLMVRLQDGRELAATVAGVDRPTDLAVLKIDAEGLTAAVFGDADALQVGEWVLAAGSPFGFDNTVTAGIVSATGRGQNLATQTDERYDEFIQTDAAINPGNSGGPLVNLEGQVVGINNQIASRSGGSVGLGFAISSSIAKPVVESLIRDGRVQRGWLGIEFGPRAGGAPGMLITSVVDGSPAAQAGLRSGDIITRFNGRPTTTGSRLRSAIAFTPPGTRAPVEILRDGRPGTVNVQLIDRTTGQAQSMGGKGYADLGIAVADLTPETARVLSYPLEVSGVIVLEVDAQGAAAEAGLQARDVIVAVNRRATPTAEAFDKIVSSVRSGGTIRFDVVGLRPTDPFSRALSWRRGNIELTRP